MLDADISSPTGPDTSEGEEGFLLTSHPLLQTHPLDGQGSFDRRFLLFAAGAIIALISLYSSSPQTPGPCGPHGVEPSGAVQT